MGRVACGSEAAENEGFAVEVIGANTMTSSPHGEVIRQVAKLIGTTLQSGTPDVDSVLGELTEAAVAAVPEARHAGITVASRGGKVRTATTTGRYPVLLDEIQQRHQQGPCLSAAWEQQMIRVDDLSGEQRWPRYCREVTQVSPIRSIMAFQLFADQRTMGALTFYADQPHAFDDGAVELGLMMATHIALAWNLVRRDEQFRSALASRDLIGQAKGMIMERFAIDASEAFELLKRLSQTSNQPLAVIARQLVESDRSADDAG